MQDLKNYDLRFGSKKLEILAIQLDQRRIIVQLKDQEVINFAEPDAAIAAKLKVNLKNIYDTEGRKLGEKTYLPANQFREFFVQKITQKKIREEDTLFINKNVSLSQNQVSDSVVNPDFWMNTPLKNN